MLFLNYRDAHLGDKTSHLQQAAAVGGEASQRAGSRFSWEGEVGARLRRAQRRFALAAESSTVERCGGSFGVWAFDDTLHFGSLGGRL